MNIALYSGFYNKLLKPTIRYRCSFLICTFLCYLFIGSYIHMLLNSSSEFDERIKLTEYLNKFYSTHNCVSRQETVEFLDLIINASDINGIILGKNASFVPSWTFSGETIFFTFTLLSTIGYGYMTPTTDLGKLFCVFYILAGVPLTYLIFYNLAEQLENWLLGEKRKANAFSHSRTYLNIYMKSFYMGCIIVVFVYVLPSVLISNYLETRWSFLDSIYYCYISISTIGFGDYVAGENITGFTRNYYNLGMTAYLFVGILMNIVFANMLRLPLMKIFNELLQERPGFYTQILNQNEDSDSVESNESIYATTSTNAAAVMNKENEIHPQSVENELHNSFNFNSPNGRGFKTKIV